MIPQYYLVILKVSTDIMVSVTLGGSIPDVMPDVKSFMS